MPKKAKTAAPASGAKKPKKAYEKPVSLYPLTFEEAVRGLLQVKMEPEENTSRRKPAGGVGKRS